MVIGEKRFFYGWVIVATGFLIYAMFGGGLYYAYGVFFPVMMAEIGFSRGVGATAVSLMLLFQGLAGPIGIVVNRIGVRKVMIAGNILMIITMVLMSRVTEVWHIYITYGFLAAMAICTSGVIPILTMINNWFRQFRGRAMSIAMAGVSIGTMILAPLSGYLIEVIGWRQTWLVLAGFASVFALLPAIFLAKSRPEEIGQTVDGKKVEPAVEAAPVPADSSRDWETKAALKTPALWLIAVMGSTTMFSLSILSTHQVAHLQDIGISPVVAASATGFLAGISIVGRLGGGALGDRFNPRYTAAACCALQAIALIIFMNARVLPLIYTYVIVFGFAYGALLVLFPTLLGDYFGRNNFSTIFGIASAMQIVIGAIGAAFAGFTFDAFGSYSVALTTAAIVVVCGGICILLARPPKPPARS
jgi:MFS family permease